MPETKWPINRRFNGSVGAKVTDVKTGYYLKYQFFNVEPLSPFSRHPANKAIRRSTRSGITSRLILFIRAENEILDRQEKPFHRFDVILQRSGIGEILHNGAFAYVISKDFEKCLEHLKKSELLYQNGFDHLTESLNSVDTFNGSWLNHQCKKIVKGSTSNGPE